MTTTSSSHNSTEDSKRATRLGPTVGIEIGHSTIYMVQLRQAPGGKLFFDKCRTFEFDPKLELKSSSFGSVLRTALQGFCPSKKRLKIWAAPQRDRARLHHFQIPRVNPSRISGAVYWALQKEERFLEKETVVDFQVEEGTEISTSVNLDITGALAERQDIEDIQHAFSLTGYSLTGIGLPLFGLRNLVNRRSEQNEEAPALICQVGQHATSVSVLLGKNSYSQETYR